MLIYKNGLLTPPPLVKPDTKCCSFSEQELVDCTNDGKNTCNIGGLPSDGVVEIATDMKGIMDTEGQYPYSSGSGTSTGKCSAASKAKTGGVQTGVTGFTPVTTGDEAAMKVNRF